MLYGSETLTNFCGEHVLLLLIALLLSYGVGILFIARTLLITCYTPFLGLLLIVCLTCYNSKILELVNKKNLVLGLTQENSIKNTIQDCLPYILIPNGLCELFLAYPK